MKREIEQLGIAIAEEYIIFLHEEGLHEEDGVVRADSFVRGFIKNLNERLAKAAIESIQEMGVDA